MSVPVADRRALLDRVLAGFDLDATRLVSQVEDVYGEPELIAATGSVIAGYGTPESDIDVLVVVDHDRLSDLPILSYPGTARVDVEYYSRTDITKQLDLVLDQPWPRPEGCTQAQWQRYYRALRTATRLECACVLRGAEHWIDMMDRLSGGALRERVANWWVTEAVRFRAGAHWLACREPILAGLRLQDAIFAALSARAASGGELILATKWLPEKLRKEGDSHGLDIFRSVLAAGPSPDCAFDGLLGYAAPLIPTPDQWALDLRAAVGLEVVDLREETLFTRWGMRGVVFRGGAGEVGLAKEGGLFWIGATDETPPAPVLDLFCQDMLWLGVRASSGAVEG